MDLCYGVALGWMFCYSVPFSVVNEIFLCILKLKTVPLYFNPPMPTSFRINHIISIQIFNKWYIKHYNLVVSRYKYWFKVSTIITSLMKKYLIFLHLCFNVIHYLSTYECPQEFLLFTNTLRNTYIYLQLHYSVILLNSKCWYTDNKFINMAVTVKC